MSSVAGLIKNIGNLMVRNEKKKDLDSRLHFPLVMSVQRDVEIPEMLRQGCRSFGVVVPDTGYLIKLKLMAMGYEEVGSKYLRVGQCLSEIESKYPELGDIKHTLLKELESGSLGMRDDLEQCLLMLIAKNVSKEVIESVLSHFINDKHLLTSTSPSILQDDTQYNNALKQLGYESNAFLASSVNQMISSKNALIVMGNSSFKTTAIQVSAAINNATTHFVNLSVYEPSLLFGYKEEDKVADGLLKKLGQEESTNWIIVEGQHQSTEGLLKYAIEGKLLYKGGDVVATPPNVKFVFEYNSLKDLSPSFVVNSTIVSCAFTT